MPTQWIHRCAQDDQTESAEFSNARPATILLKLLLNDWVI